MTNAFFLNWIAARIVHVYGESEHVDFVTKLRGIAAGERAGDSKAITALTRMVKAFGSGVSAANTAQAGALAEAYACIEADLRAKRPEAEPAHVAKPYVEPVPAQPATMHPYTKEEPAVLPDSWEKDDAARAAVDEIEKCARASIGVRVAIKFSDEKAGSVIGTICTVTHHGYVCFEEDGASGTCRLNEVESIEPIAVTDSWPGGDVSLNSYLNARVGKLVTVNYGARGDVTGEIFRNPLRPGQYQLLLRTGSTELFISDVVSVSCDK
jgi:hypothetical protein